MDELKIFFKTKVNWYSVCYVTWCALLGFVGWLKHDPNIYQPLYAWMLGSILFNSLTIPLIIILSSFITSIFIIGHDNIIKQFAEMGYKEPKNCDIGDKISFWLSVFLYGVYIFFVAYIWLYN